MIINSNELTKKIRDQIKEERNSIIIVSAFCKLEALRFIESNINPDIKEKKNIITMEIRGYKS